MVCIKPLMHIMTRPLTSSQRIRRDHSPELKRELVERCSRPGASVSAIALEAGINANLLFAWRRAHRAAIAASDPAAATPTLLPVTIQEPIETVTSSTTNAPAARTVNGTIEIDIGRSRLRVRGAVDEDSLRCALQTLHALA
jgi:transposase